MGTRLTTRFDETMPNTIRDVLSESSDDRPPGWQARLARIRTCLEDDGPIVVWLHGPVGAGKTALMAEVLRLARHSEVRVVRIDCRTIEPTAAGLLGYFSELLETELEEPEHAACFLSALGPRVLIEFDNYEVFRLADTWLRLAFIPALGSGARVVFVSREPPSAGWLSAMEWQPYFLRVSLSPQPGSDPDGLARRLLGISDPAVLEALEAVSVVRRITRPMLAALCPASEPATLYEALASLSFVESRRDGLAMQDDVRKIIGGRLQAADPTRYRAYQQQAWKLMRRQLRESARADLWRNTADTIYLIENPVIREAFFPSESARYSVQPAMPDDKRDIMQIASRHEPPGAVRAAELWWKHMMRAFHMVRDAAGSAVGYYCMARPDELFQDWMRQDPVAGHWQRHLSLRGASNRVPALFLRRWLSIEDGEHPCAVQAAAWIDIKRTYLELRPGLRRVYLALQDVGPYGPVATQLGFTVLEDLSEEIGGSTYYTAMLDFGPASVDGWISDLVAAELGIAEDRLLDPATRELVLDGRRIALTRLEYGLISALENRAGEAVARAELLQSVWGKNYEGGSNVVDAVVRGLRRKCGADADILETVRGVGYRLRA